MEKSENTTRMETWERLMYIIGSPLILVGLLSLEYFWGDRDMAKGIGPVMILVTLAFMARGIRLLEWILRIYFLLYLCFVIRIITLLF